MKRQFTEKRIHNWDELTEEQAVRVVLGDYGLIVYKHEGSIYPEDQYMGALYRAVKMLEKNPSSLNNNSLVYAALNYEPDHVWEASYFCEALVEADSEGAAIFAYFNFLHTEDRTELWRSSVANKDFKAIPVLEEIVEWVLIYPNDENEHRDFPLETELLKQGKSLNPQGFSGDERISKDALTAIILLGNFPMNEKMLEAGIWSIQRQGLQEILCTIFAYNQNIFPEHLQNTAKKILKELNPEFVEYVKFVQSRKIS